MTEALMQEANSQNADAQQAAATQSADSTQQAAAAAATESQAATQQTATQTQSADDAATQGNSDTQQAADPQGSKQADGAPEQYEFAAPEGQSFDPSVISAYSEVAKELNLSQEAAQKVLDKMGPILATRSSEQVSQAVTQWSTESKADKEFGGDALNENLAVAKRGLDAYGSPALKELLNKSGLGNHPEIIRAFWKAGKAISEDGIVTGGPSVLGGKSIADTLYDKTSARSN